MRFGEFIKPSATVPNIIDSHIYCDMDGVLVDFDYILKEKMADKYYARKNPAEHINITSEDWARMNEDPDMWEKLPIMPGAIKLWSYISVYNPHILTAWNGNEEHAKRGKWNWMVNNFSFIDRSRFHCVQRKEKLQYAYTGAAPNILIDDYITNVEEWTKAGGVAIYYRDCEQAITELKQIGF